MARKEKTPEAPAKTKTELFFEKLKAIRERHRNGDCGVQTVRNYGMREHFRDILKKAQARYDLDPSGENRSQVLIAKSNFAKWAKKYKNSDADYEKFKVLLAAANKAGTRRPIQ